MTIDWGLIDTALLGAYNRRIKKAHSREPFQFNQVEFRGQKAGGYPRSDYGRQT
jgi:hypothetical protein